MTRCARSMATRQRGITLIVVMIVLAVVMILGVGGAQIALLGERSTRFDRDYLVASQAAEAALMDAEFDIYGWTPPVGVGTRTTLFTPTNLQIFQAGCGSSGTSLGLCLTSTTTKPVWATADFVGGSNTVTFGAFTGRTFTSATTNGAGGIQPALPPRYIIELVPDTGFGNPPGTYMYRITAMGFGPRSEVQVVLQTSYRK